jgi:hypothetical protein
VTQAGPAGSSRPRRAWLGWVFLAALLLYTFAIHHGIGPGPKGVALSWYTPRGFLAQWSWLGVAFASTPRAMAVFALPALALGVGVFATGRSAVARALAVSCVVATLLFVFYGDYAAWIWELFHWRGSAVMAVMSLVLGFALCAPALAASWLRLAWPVRLLVYLPVVLGALAFVRNATGTDPALRYSISPWPAVAVFGIEVGALFVAAGLAGIALGLAGIAGWREGHGTRAALWLAGGLLLGLGVPLALLALGASLDLFPFDVGPRTLGGAALACAVAIGLGAIGSGGISARRRALGSATGALLIGAPLLLGQAWARWDYSVTREQHARAIIDAAERYYDNETLYPDSLDQLVAGGDLAAIPEPAIGFGFFDGADFRYQSFGQSFLLEFSAPRWVECAYTPAYRPEEGEELDPEDDEEFLAESWSCPSKPPDLW